MLQKVERLFCRESQRIDIRSQVLLHTLADQRAEKNFHFIMAVIRKQTIKKIFRERMKVVKGEEEKAHGRKFTMREIKDKMTTNAQPIDTAGADQDPDNLITYREFMSAIKDPKDNLFFKILPQSLNLLDVLKSVPQEVAFSVSDVQ